MSDDPEKGSVSQFSDLSPEIDCAVIGLTIKDPAHDVGELKTIGIKNFWIHWRTETDGTKKMSQDAVVHYIAGRCPMMYLADKGFNMHSIHRAVAKILGKY